MINELQLLKGVPIDVGQCKVHPLTLGEIVELGELKYNQYLTVLMLDKSSVNFDAANTPELKAELEKITSYDVLVLHAQHDKGVRQISIEALSLFLGEPVNYSENGFFYFGEIWDNRPISKEAFEKIKTVIKKQNYLPEKEKESKYANEKTRELAEKIKKIKDKLKEKNKEEGLSLSDITSIVSVYSNDINILSVWNLTIYQLYESYLRLIMWDNYHTSYLHLPHMDEESRSSLQHWASKTKTN